MAHGSPDQAPPVRGARRHFRSDSPKVAPHRFAAVLIRWFDVTFFRNPDRLNRAKCTVLHVNDAALGQAGRLIESKTMTERGSKTESGVDGTFLDLPALQPLPRIAGVEQAHGQVPRAAGRIPVT